MIYHLSRRQKQHGFTIVELLIVIVVIGILAAITIVSFNGVSARATFAKEKSEMATINKAIRLYYSENGTYPSTGGTNTWSGFGQGQNFVPGLTPTYISKTPQLAPNSNIDNSYLYTSNGTDYKLIRYSDNVNGLPSVQMNNSLTDPVRPAQSRGAWGYWTAGAATW